MTDKGKYTAFSKVYAALGYSPGGSGIKHWIADFDQFRSADDREKFIALNSDPQCIEHGHTFEIASRFDAVR